MKPLGEQCLHANHVIGSAIVTARKVLHNLTRGHSEDTYLPIYEASAAVSRDFLAKDLNKCREENPAAAEVMAKGAQAVIDTLPLANRYGSRVPADAAKAYGEALTLFEQELALDPEVYAQVNADPSSWE